MHAGDDPSTGFITVVGIEPAPMFLEDFCLVIWEELGWIKEWSDEFFDSSDSSVAYLPGLIHEHGSLVDVL